MVFLSWSSQWQNSSQAEVVQALITAHPDFLDHAASFFHFLH